MANINQQQATQIAQAFSSHYYNTFDSQRGNLASLYQQPSQFSFEGQTFIGQQDIVNKLNSLPFTKVQHAIKTIDAQPSGNGILIMVNGDIKVDDQQNALKFSQTFQLIPTDAQCSNFWIYNDIFRLNYG